MMQYRKHTLYVVTIALLVACGGGGSEEPRHTVVDTEFTVGVSPGWFTYVDENAGCEDVPVVRDSTGRTTYAVSSSPWWLDTNHAAPGLGYLHLVAFAFHEQFSIDGIVKSPRAGTPIDLRHGRVTIRWRAPNLTLPAAARLLFWFQTAIDPGTGTGRRFINHVLSSQPLRARSGTQWQTDVLELNPDPANYACLGSQPEKVDLYGCDIDPTTALAHWNVDLGFVLLFPEASQSASINGAVEIDRVAIDIPESSAQTSAMTAATMTQIPNSCRR